MAPGQTPRLHAIVHGDAVFGVVIRFDDELPGGVQKRAAFL